jgi:sugar phosphate isomerase/epimerase
MSAHDLLNRAAELGVRVVQIADNLLNEQQDLEGLPRVVEQARILGIDLEWGMAGLAPERIRRGLFHATEVGSSVLRLLLDTPQHHPTPDEVVSTLSGLLPEFERAGVTLAIENHDRFRAATLLDILRRLQSDAVGICFDTANSIGCLESAERVLDVLGPRVVNVHIKDYCISRPAHQKGFVVEGRAAGRGQLAIGGLISRLRELGRDPNVIIELWPPPQSTLAESVALESAWAGESVHFLRTFISD